VLAGNRLGERVNTFSDINAMDYFGNISPNTKYNLTSKIKAQIHFRCKGNGERGNPRNITEQLKRCVFSLHERFKEITDA